MTFKYQRILNELGIADCPPAVCQRTEMTAFRFVFEDLEHPSNFLPVGLIHPQRLNDFHAVPQKCQAFGLSFFAERAMAETHYHKLQQKTAGRFAKTVGDHLAAVSLSKNDGVHSDPLEHPNTHFTFHESEAARLKDLVLHFDLL